MATETNGSDIATEHVLSWTLANKQECGQTTIKGNRTSSESRLEKADQRSQHRSNGRLNIFRFSSAYTRSAIRRIGCSGAPRNYQCSSAAGPAPTLSASSMPALFDESHTRINPAIRIHYKYPDSPKWFRHGPDIDHPVVRSVRQRIAAHCLSRDQLEGFRNKMISTPHQ